MSWSPRADAGGAPQERAPHQPHQPPPHQQPFVNQQAMYPSYQGAPPPATGQQQQYWPQQQQYPQQYAHVYQQDYGNNANQLYQQPQYNQNYPASPPAYTNNQQGYQQAYYQNQGVPQAYPQGKPNTDSWEDNWDWGWEETSKQAQNAAAKNSTPMQAVPPQHMFNNANVIEESFASTDTWNWSMEDKKGAKEPLPPQQEPATLPTEITPRENNSLNDPPVQRNAGNPPVPQPAEEVRTLGDRDVVKERLPNLALGKRFHLDNLTPQWSIESQMSQESSDGPLTHSEGTYRSDNQSRNSSKSSPGLNTDNSNFNYSQSGLDEYPPSSEWSRQSNDEPTLVDNAQSHDELSSSLQDMSIAHREHPAPGAAQVHKGGRQEPAPTMAPPPSISPANFPPPVSSVLPPPPSLSSANTLAAPIASSATMPPPPTSAVLPPPTNFPPSSTNTNPFKQSGSFSHKKVPTVSTSIHSFPPSISSTSLTSPGAVNKVSQHRVPVGYGANLETTPDNAERPDQPQMPAFRPMPVSLPQPVPDNMEVAPQNDRNEYLQTAHLSSGDYGENTDFSRNLAPPGLRRMVVGQQESEYGQNMNISGDEPPPGLARMVPGQQTEADNGYNQPGDNYMDRHIDGQQTDGGGRPYRQADGQITPDNYTQPPTSRGQERRPIGFDRMVPGEPSNDEYPQYQGSNYGVSSEQRVVMGVEHDYPGPADAGPADVREHNVDGSDYSEQTPRNPPRNLMGVRENNDVSQDFPPAEEQQREVIMEGENLQDLSVISSGDLTFSREQTLDGADVNATDAGLDRKTDASDSMEHLATGSRRQSLNRVNSSGEESDRDRAFKSSPRRDRDKHKSSRDRDRERDKDGRYSSRGDRKYDREPERRSARDDWRPEKDRRDRDRDRDRRERDESPNSRRHRRSARSHRYETEDTDYYSDRERDRRRHREGSYASKPPRPDDKRRPDERTRRYHTIERERRYGAERPERAERSERRERDRYGRYRDIDPSRKHGNLRQERDDEERKRVVTFSGDAQANISAEGGEVYSSGSRPGSREAAGATDDEVAGGAAGVAADARRRDQRRARHRQDRDRDRDPYYDGGYGAPPAGYGADPYALTRQQYQYYEHLRRADPAAYMLIYKQLMAGRAPPPPPPAHAHAHAAHTQHLYSQGYGSLVYEGRAEGRGSGHSGRSSDAGLKGNDTYYLGGAGGAAYRAHDASSLRDAPSLRTDLSDRDLNTDASLNLHLEESTVRSERMTPYKFSTAHIKGNISSRHVVVVRPSYPVDGLPATVHVMSLEAALAADPQAVELARYPGPLVKGVTHKKSVMEYCAARVRGAGRAGGRDVTGYVLLWELLALLLRQNGVVVGADVAELLLNNSREYEHRPNAHAHARTAPHNDSRRGSSLSGREEEARWSPPPDTPSAAASSDVTPQDVSSPADDGAALAKLREYLLCGNRQEALEWAMCNNQWGHALALSALGERRTRGAVWARFLSALPPADTLHTLYAHLQARQPPAATCAADDRWGDWRPHAAIMLANTSARPEQDRRTLTQLGDSLSSRGLLYSAQFCYVSAGVPFSQHPLAPLQPAPPAPAPPAACPRLALLLADPRADSLRALATNQAIFATEIYEYALSLNQEYVIEDLQVYKLVLASRLVDAGQYQRALAYAEQAARAVTRAPGRYSRAFVAQLAELADRLRYHEPAGHEDPALMEDAPGGDSGGEPSPRHHQQWLEDVKSLAGMLSAGASSQPASPLQQARAQPGGGPAQYGGWGEQNQPQYQAPAPPVCEPDETPDYAHYYHHQQQHSEQQQHGEQQQLSEQQQLNEQQQLSEQQQQYGYGDEWTRAGADDQPHTYADPYWQADQQYGYGEAGAGGAAVGAVVGSAGAGGEAARPVITMPGGAPAGARPPLYHDFDDDRPPSADPTDRETDSPKSAAKKQDKAKDEPKGEGRGKGGGWLGGILTKLSLRPPNQMILPDDKNPTIVWDAEHKRWRNTDGDESDAASQPPPPPTGIPGLASTGPTPAAGGGPPAAPMSNIFKMQKGRHIKKSYVDVFNPSGAPTRPLPPPAEVLGPAPVAHAHPTNYFVPVQHNNNELVQISMPCTPEPEPPPSPDTSRTPTPTQSGVYDPAQAAAAGDTYHSGI